ncbi:hypothetical protein C3B51_12460 [Pseudoalteromonas rubra]|uniref:Uncharacterized protein n=1 Tax=Pseudoalteromonas rubra TaxID=43658 RepID=A0A4Q7ECQ9_9GAMM|nr:hypothetical protein [Pseudoalteromonas rubra]RZM80365.1 hypothetical protein C3B51_12460 [Pseudoalteromonas rubra]
MDDILSESNCFKRWFYKYLCKGLYPSIFGAISFGYIGIPTNIQEMIRRQLPEGWRSYLLELLNLEQWFTLLLGLAVLGVVWGGVGSHLRTSLIKKHYEKVKEENRRVKECKGRLKQEIDSKVVNCYDFFSYYLHNNYFSKLGLSIDERVSLYRLDLDLFVCVGRYSDNEEYKQRPSRVYSRNEGCIAKVWQRGVYQDVIPFDPSLDLEGWVSYNVEKHSFDEETVRQINMKSRAFLGIRIQNSKQETIAVLIFESINDNGLKFSKIQKSVNTVEKNNLCHLFESLESHMPNLQIARAEGF